MNCRHKLNLTLRSLDTGATVCGQCAVVLALRISREFPDIDRRAVPWQEFGFTPIA